VAKLEDALDQIFDDAPGWGEWHSREIAEKALDELPKT